MLLKLPRRTGGDAYLWLLLEFQVRPERFMALRVLVYVVLLYEHLLRTEVVGSLGKLPPVFAVVFYHGERKWSAPTQLGGLIDLPPESPLQPWQPEGRFYLLKEQVLQTGPVETCTNAAELLIRLNQCRDASAFALVIKRLAQVLSVEDDRQLNRLLVHWIHGVLLCKHDIDLRPEDVKPLMEEHTVGLEQYAEEIIKGFKDMGLEEGRAIGHAEGLAEGHAEGRAEGHAEGRLQGVEQGQREALLMMLDVRFGGAEPWEGLVELGVESGQLQALIRLAIAAQDKGAFVEAAKELLGT